MLFEIIQYRQKDTGKAEDLLTNDSRRFSDLSDSLSSLHFLSIQEKKILVSGHLGLFFKSKLFFATNCSCPLKNPGTQNQLSSWVYYPLILHPEGNPGNSHLFRTCINQF